MGFNNRNSNLITNTNIIPRQNVPRQNVNMFSSVRRQSATLIFGGTPGCACGR